MFLKLKLAYFLYNLWHHFPGAPKQQDVNKPKTELENQMHISVTSPKKYLHKGKKEKK